MAGQILNKGTASLSSVLIRIEGALYERVERASRHMACGKKCTKYGLGFLNEPDDPYKVQRTGLLGEAAFAIWSKLPLDLSYKPGGDHSDFVVHGKAIDVKCAYRNYEMNLIVRREFDGGKFHPLKDIYVGSYITYDFPQHWTAQVRLLGYNVRKELEKVAVTPSSRGVHLNTRLLHRDLQPLQRLKDFIDGKICYENL